MRDGWTPDANYMLLDCGPHGTNNCGHAHADALAFEIAAQDERCWLIRAPTLIPGRKELRDWFRFSAAHNALTVDGESSSVSAGPFSWSTIAKCERHAWISRERFDYFEGKHDGYERLVPPVAHSRGVLFLKNDYWVIRDRRSNQTASIAMTCGFTSTLDAAPSLEFSDDFGARLREVGDRSRIEDQQLCQVGPAGAGKTATVSHCYGERAAAEAYVFSTTASGDEDLVTFLMPQGRTLNRQKASARSRQSAAALLRSLVKARMTSL